MPIQSVSQALGNETGGSSLIFKNRLINGNFEIDQRYDGASVAINSQINGGDPLAADKWFVILQTGSGATRSRSTDAPPGFKNSLKITTGTGASPTENIFNYFFQPIEGNQISDWKWGTVDAKPATLSFWVKSSVIGTYGVCIRDNGDDNAQSKTFMASYTINQANTWEYKVVNVPAPTSGNFGTLGTSDNAFVTFDLGMGANKQTTAQGDWQTNTVVFMNGLSGGVKLCAQSNATWFITGVQLEAGNTATTFEKRPVAVELEMCQRYLQVLRAGTIGWTQGNGSTIWYANYFPKVTFRKTPTTAIATAALFLDQPGLLNRTQSSADATVATFSSPDAVAVQCGNFTNLPTTGGYGIPLMLRHDSSGVVILIA